MKADIKIKVEVSNSARKTTKIVTVDGVWARDDLILVWKWEPREPGVPAESFTVKNARSRVAKTSNGLFELRDTTVVVPSVEDLR